MIALPARLVAVVSALAVLAIAGCAPASPTPSATPTETARPSATPTASPSPQALSSPLPVLDLTCDELATPTLATVMPTDRTVRDPAVTVMNEMPLLAPQYSVRSLGGLACEWSNGLPHDPYGAPPTYTGVTVLVLPDGTAQHDHWSQLYGDGAMTCTTDGAYCASDELVGTTWVSIRIERGVSTAAAAYASEVAAAVAAAGTGSAPWTPDTTLTGDCTAIIGEDAVRAAIGIDAAVDAVPPHGGWSLEAGADQDNGTIRCSWLLPDSDVGVGSLGALPGGAWAWAEARGSVTTPSTASPLAVAGLADGDEAWLRCRPDAGLCTVDLVIGEDWIEFTLWPPEWTMDTTYDRRAGAEALAAAIVAARP